MRVAIVGSRDFPDLPAVREYVRGLDYDDHVVTGGAQGVDLAAEGEARRLGLGFTVYTPNYSRYAKQAPFRRNQRIVDDCDRLVAFWLLASSGTADAIERAEKAGKPVEIRRPR